VSDLQESEACNAYPSSGWKLKKDPYTSTGATAPRDKPHREQDRPIIVLFKLESTTGPGIELDKLRDGYKLLIRRRVELEI
jgi:hypothetical protein